MTLTLLDSIVHATFFLAIGFILGTLHAEYKQMHPNPPAPQPETRVELIQGQPFYKTGFGGMTNKGPIEAQPPHLNRDAMLYAISQVESGGNPGAVGKNGEVSEWQLSKEVIQDFYSMPKSGYAAKPVFTYRDAAIWRLGVLISQHGNDPLAIYNAWNPGVSAEKAQRVVNLYAMKVTEMEGAK